MMTGNIPVYYINLDSSDERRASIEAGLLAAGIPHAERVSAFDGRKIDLTRTADVDLKKAYRFLGRPLRGAEYGCYKSHLDCIDRFLATDSAYGIVLEDDAEIDPMFCKVVEETIAALEAKGEPWDIVHLGPNKMKIYTPTDHLSGGHDLVRAHYFPMLTTALLWSREGARNVQQNHALVTMPVDTQFREIMVQRGSGYAIWPPITSQTGVDSDIDGNGAVRKATGRSWYYGWAKQHRLWRNKIIAWFRQRDFRRAK
ncbi:glycosyltransferase family 25 protein [Pseudogemmobacter faecipullorum]|uniref:Glycosyltransferase family 25 protein n=1 Tax=Pseudogemmobacter faecipullorum TaxID=2755041 RepID=A0ABS8CSC3_9RHOB|nr:glycosyltransferase family 25 protein [Pseudogemmobacter faecipullorum]MCB5412316.1 glycosyltransferase family 25 protein [Pseudogemmobacter faecipullorum]